MSDPRISEVIGWWRDNAGEWFAQSPAFDAAFRARFADLHAAAAAGDRGTWEDTAEGCLALLILLDQYPRNAFRGSAAMYGTDVRARAVAHHALAAGFVAQVPTDLRMFMLLPFSHSETPDDQALAVALHRRYLPSGLRRAERHRDIIARFGRFPHRQPILGNPLTPDESRYLNSGGFRG